MRLVSDSIRRKLPIAGYVWLALATSGTIAYTYYDTKAEERAHQKVTADAIYAACVEANLLRVGIRGVLSDYHVPKELSRAFIASDCRKRAYGK